MARGRMLSKSPSHWKTVAWSDFALLPRYGGVYVLYSKGTLLYVGRTGNLRSRLSAHTKKGPDTVKYRRLPSPCSQRRVESLLIARLRPALNKAIYQRNTLSRERYGWWTR